MKLVRLLIADRIVRVTLVILSSTAIAMFFLPERNSRHVSRRSKTYILPHSRAAYQLLLEHEIPISLNRLRDTLEAVQKNNGASIEACSRVLKAAGVRAQVVKTSFEEFVQLSQPVVIRGPRGNPIVAKLARSEFYLIDYPQKQQPVSESFLRAIWPGSALLVDVDPDSSWGSSSLNATPRLIDFGSIDAGIKLERIVSITNPTSKPIAVTRVDTSCGCALLTGDLKEIAPEETVKFVLGFDSEGKQGFQEYLCIVQANDGFLPVRISGYVHVPSGFNPRAVDFGRVALKEVAEKIITFTGVNKRGEDRSIVLSAAAPHPLSCRIFREPNGDSTRISERLHVKFTAGDVPLGNHEGLIKVEYRSGNEKQKVQIPYRASVIKFQKNRKLFLIRSHDPHNAIMRDVLLPEISFAAVRDFSVRQGDEVASVTPKKSKDGKLLLKVRATCRNPGPNEIVVNVRVDEDLSSVYEIIIIICCQQKAFS